MTNPNTPNRAICFCFGCGRRISRHAEWYVGEDGSGVSQYAHLRCLDASRLRQDLALCSVRRNPVGGSTEGDDALRAMGRTVPE